MFHFKNGYLGIFNPGKNGIASINSYAIFSCPVVSGRTITPISFISTSFLIVSYLNLPFLFLSFHVIVYGVYLYIATLKVINFHLTHRFIDLRQLLF
jgi:hypothetical protein